MSYAVGHFVGWVSNATYHLAEASRGGLRSLTHPTNPPSAEVSSRGEPNRLTPKTKRSAMSRIRSIGSFPDSGVRERRHDSRLSKRIEGRCGVLKAHPKWSRAGIKEDVGLGTEADQVGVVGVVCIHQGDGAVVTVGGRGVLAEAPVGHGESKEVEALSAAFKVAASCSAATAAAFSPA